MEKIGETLRNARLAQNISIDDVVSETKIRSRYIEAMEEERWEIFPGKVYLKGFLKSYINLLELDEEEIVARFDEEYKSQEPEVQRAAPSKIEMPGRPQRKTGLIVVILAIIVLIAFNYVYTNYIQPVPAIDNKPQGWNNEENSPISENSSGTNNEDDDPSGPIVEEPMTVFTIRLLGVQGRCWVRVNENQQKIYEGILNPGDEKEFQDLKNVTIMYGNSYTQTFINEADYGRLGSDEHVVTKTYTIEDNKVKEVVN